MNDKQKEFLKELKILFEKYNIQKVNSVDDKIMFWCTTDCGLGFRDYTDTTYKADYIGNFSDVTTIQGSYKPE